VTEMPRLALHLRSSMTLHFASPRFCTARLRLEQLMSLDVTVLLTSYAEIIYSNPSDSISIMQRYSDFGLASSYLSERRVNAV
jgi:hypothetical protein